MTNEQLQTCADRLWEAARNATPCAPLTDQFALDETAAYAVQRINNTRRIAAGARPVGWKVGLTSTAIQQWLNVSEPDFGMLLDEMQVLDGGAVAASKLLQPRAEGEVAFVIAEPLSADATTTDVLGATAYLLPAIEIIDSRVADWKIAWGDTVADNASSGMYVLGSTPVAVDAVDLRLAGMTLRKNGEVVSTGAGAACLGHPVNAVAWLARTLARLGEPLQPGDVVLSGALGPVTPVAAGDWLTASIAGVGDVGCRFT